MAAKISNWLGTRSQRSHLSAALLTDDSQTLQLGANSVKTISESPSTIQRPLYISNEVFSDLLQFIPHTLHSPIDFCDISRSEKTILVFLKYFSHN